MLIRHSFIAAAFGLSLVASAANAQAPGPQRTLVVAVSSDPANLEPGTNRAEPIGSEIIFNVFDTLLAWKAPNFDALEGRLAESWTVSPSGTEFTFKLRSGVKFHDGTDFNAEAVKFSFERTRDINPFMKASFDPIAGIAVSGPLEIKITLNKPMPVFLSLLAQPQAAIVSPAAVAKSGAAFNVNPVGTGPFRFGSYTPDTNVVLNENPAYFRGAPKLGRIIYRIIPDASTRRLELENGGVDIIQQNSQLSAIPAEDMKAFANHANIEILNVPSQIIRQLEFNNNRTDSPVKDVRVRRAIASAIDYDGLVNGVLAGSASRVYGPVPTNSWAFNPKIRDLAPKYDPARARALLAEAGVAPGSLKLVMYTFQGSLWGSVATFLQANLAAVGIEATIQQTEFPAYRDLHVAGRHEIALDGRQPWYNDPDAHVTIGYYSPLAATAMTFRMPEDAALNKLIMDAQSVVSLDDRKQLYFQAQEQILDRVPGAYLFSNNLVVFKRKNVKGLVINSAPPLNEYWSVFKE
jgi:peptide/nickel transport system substrate-binding protein